MSRQVSVLLPFVPARAEQAAPFGAFVQWRGAHALWQGQGSSTEQHQIFTQLGGMGMRMPFGIGVSLMALRHPLLAALEARTLAASSGHPVVAGFGPGARSFQASILGEPYASPLTASREYLTLVRALLQGGEVDHRGTYFSYTGALPQVPAPNVDIGLGVLRPGMARLAGESADVAITWLTPPGYVRDVLVPALREGAEAAGRPMPRVVTFVATAAAADDRDLVATLAQGSSGHFEGPHYRDMLQRAGVQVRDTDHDGIARGLLRSGGMLAGDADEIGAGVAAFHDAGVDEVVLNCAGVAMRWGPRAVLSDLDRLFSGNAW
ncbi:LLM class flavin-dependent oxidoreductase [Streptomyces sp. NPDC057099]|uniref:LLM class flavin-dependent oxidoreductase n=1 Tax=Streptomyces sp. NPDC057099 TaxID=3346019 RepID=UPI0036454558